MGIERSQPRWIRPAAAAAAAAAREDHPARVTLTPMDIKMPNVHMPLVLAFPSAPPDFVSRLEDGLVRVLGSYREFAGRIRSDDSGRPSIHLSDEGAALVEANASHKLIEYLKLEHVRLHELTPMSAYQAGMAPPAELLLIQVTRFSCGGITLGLARHHHVVDSNGFAVFLLDWAASVKGLPISTPPLHDRSLLMPRDPPRPQFEHEEYKVDPYKILSSGGAMTTANIHFSAQQLARLKSECSADDGAIPRTTFEALSAHLWRSITRARGVDGETMFVCPVNGRRALSIPSSFFGNVVFRACTEAIAQDLLDMPLSHAAALLHGSLKKISTPDYLQSAVDLLALRGKPSTSPPLAAQVVCDPHVVITSWSRLPLYDVDFGFGTPILAAPTDCPAEGYITVAPSSKKDGSLQVIVKLQKHHMAALLSLLH